MPKFTVVRLIDAYVRTEKVVEAENEAEAKEIAQLSDEGWENEYVMEFDDTRFEVEDPE